MITAHPIPPSHGRGDVFYLFLYKYHGRDGARVYRISHHGGDKLGNLKNTLIHGASRPWGEGKQVAVAVTANGHGHDHVFLAHHGRDRLCWG